ncbi:hypothetical protein DAEQUDRAFT_732307 [Daedalea quercina L-15889]|uniref:GmrSD restriction endonucleases N-terminal domain-containing protein n=1 Tax=Daedalea quercina L-15889 TaxID=1314783 RepID=A0A165LP48_9APHY|nr:hypothetical protein DAEQUDRAFT_732307 [Daedalea quercina L-15889]
MSDFEDYSDGEEDVPLSQRSARPNTATPGNGDDAGGYKMKGALKAPRPTSYTTQALFDQMIAGDIDTDPDYQRDVVWPETKQTGLIDSIFRNFYVPPLIFAVTYRDDGSECRVSIDGKQRLTSIRRFMQGEIMYKDANTGEKFVYEDIGKWSGAKILPERYRKIFRAKQIVCIEYQDITNANEREIFQRVQLGMALTPAERLQAIMSPTSDFIHDLRAQYVSPSDEPGLSTLLDWDIARGNDFRCLVHAVYSIYRWPNVATFPSVTTLTKWVERDEELEPKFTAGVHQTMDIFLMLARENRGAAFKMADVKKVSPAEFIAIVVLIHIHKSKLGAGATRKAIRDMRRGVREKEHDIRTNKRVMSLLWDFIRTVKPEHYKGQDEMPVAKARPLKRKRRDDDDAMSVDGEDRKPPVKKKVEPKEEPMPTVSQAHAMAYHTSRTPRPTSRPSAAPTPTPPQPYPAPTYFAPPSQDRLAALRAAKQTGSDIPSSQPPQLHMSQHPYIPAPSFSSAPGPPPLLQQQASPSNLDIEKMKAQMAAQELMNGNVTWPRQYPIPQASGQAQPAPQPAYRH